MKHWDAAYVINLDHRNDRWESISKMAQTAGIHIERWDATKAADIDLEVHRIGTRVKKQSCVACWSSHVKLYRHALEKGYDRLLVLEDDADIPADLIQQVDHLLSTNDTSDFDLVYLGSADKYPAKQFSENLSISQYTLLTHAMLFSRKGMQKVIEYIDNNDDGKCRMSIDVFLAEIIQPQGKTFQAVPSIIKTIKAYSDIAGWTRSWEEVQRSVRTQGLKNPKKWASFESKSNNKLF